MREKYPRKRPYSLPLNSTRRISQRFGVNVKGRFPISFPMASASRSRNTILLVQYNLTIGSRTFMEFETLAAAMDEICALFERELKALNPSQSNMTYDIADLYAYIDQLCDISCLVYVCSTKLSVVLLPLILTLTLCAGTISQYRRTFRGTRTGLRSSCTCIYGRQPQKASWAPHGPPERACAGMPFALACGLERPVGRREVARFRSEGEVSVFSFHVLAFNERRFNKAADTADTAHLEVTGLLYCVGEKRANDQILWLSNTVTNPGSLWAPRRVRLEPDCRCDRGSPDPALAPRSHVKTCSRKLGKTCRCGLEQGDLRRG